MSRVPLDTWTKREQLCLASAVSCSGDQNWITVSRTLKSVCGNGGNTRPVDWYSQKNCAVQYGHLLETVESTKRKKRTNESGSAGFSSPATVTVETPTELLLRRLTDERLLEIKAQMRRDQEIYSKVQREIEALQSDEMSEQQLQQMWQEIEKEQETKRIDEMKLENRMREREQRKKEMASNWRNSANNRRSNLTADTTSVDMEVEDIAGIANATSNSKQQSAPAPLLTSLLKSPGSNNATSPTTPSAVTGSGSVARATAPTITSLLTSGASAIPNQPAIIMKSPNDAAFMTRPISGPPVADVTTTGRSPSQSAPTLSMLLEKNKLAAAASPAVTSNESTVKTEDSTQKSPSAEPGTTPATEDAVDESDAEEQQLLEVFKNVHDIIDDMDIVMAGVIDEDILKDVDNVESPSTAQTKSEDVDLGDKFDTLKREQSDTANSSKSPAAPKPVEVVIGSSDDSNDNIPLATVASQESKERILQPGENASSATASTIDAAVEELSETITIASTSSEENTQETAADTITDPVEAVEKSDTAASEATAAAADPTKESAENVGNQETKTETEQTKSAAEELKEETTKPQDVEAEKAKTESNNETKTSAPAAASSVHDTDEESSQTDSSKADEPTRSTKTTKQQQAESKAEAETTSSGTRQTPPSSTSGIATAPAPVTARAPLLRKLPHRDRSESPMVDDDTTTASDHSTARSSTRRRCSSTPVIDSIPNSPASSEHTDDRRETRAASKKLFLSIFNTLQESKHAASFRRAFHDEHSNKQVDLCLRPMDLPTIKRNIDSGHIRSTSELQRDVLLMCQNLLVVYKLDTTQHKTARLFMQECRALKEFAHVASSQSDNSSVTSGKGEKEKERPLASSKVRSGSRKSQRHH